MTERLRLAIERVGLFGWFVAIDLLWIAKPEVLAIDARHYQRAASAWLAGGDPWAVTEAGIPYAAGPHTLLFFAPTSVLPLAVSTAVWMIAGLLASLWLMRRLELPLWWIAFPPLMHGIWNGNPQTLALALLVAGGPMASTIAVGLKLYAAVPLVTRWRHLVFAGIVLGLVLLILPWQLYLDNGFGVGSHLQTAWNGSAWRLPILIPPTLVALWILRRHGAEWHAVPALFPATQFYYVAMALPAIARRPLAAAALALPMPLMAPIVVMALAVVEVSRGRRFARQARTATPPPTQGSSPGLQRPPAAH